MRKALMMGSRQTNAFYLLMIMGFSNWLWLVAMVGLRKLYYQQILSWHTREHALDIRIVQNHV